MIGDDRPSLEELSHFGVKGMHWGRHKTVNTMKAMPQRPTSKYTPTRPRETSTKTHGKPQSQADQLVSKVINQGYERVTHPAMNAFIKDIPSYKAHPDPRINALLNRSLDQGLDRIETDAGREFISRLPTTYRQ